MNQLDGRGELALDIALCAKQSSIARTLVDHQADLNARDTRGFTLLHRAVERGVYSTTFSNVWAISVRKTTIGAVCIHAYIHA